MQDRPAAPSRDTPSLTLRIARPVARAWLWATGFKLEGEMPDLAKAVIIAVPHTTNWDLPHTLAAGLGTPVNWMGKSSIFRWPFGGVMRCLGGIAVDRSQTSNAVDRMIETFAARDRLRLVIAPAGTRNAVTKWKSGFYHIAHGARVPIVLAFIDYKRKAVGVAGVFEPTGDYDADLPKIEAIYARNSVKPPV
jgi:1-acyl-sn-glycerol-3-phosphate acyltransferase